MSHKTVVLIVASQGYQPVEYGHTRKALEDAGLKVVIASDIAGIAHARPSNGRDEHAHYASVNVDVVISEIDPNKYDGIFIIGGPGSTEHLDNPATYDVMQKAAKADKPLGAICISPRILAHAGLLDGKKATGWNGDNEVENVFKHYGAEYVDEPVVTDGKIVTADGPKAATDFGNAIVAVLAKN